MYGYDITREVVKTAAVLHNSKNTIRQILKAIMEAHAQKGD
jgi:hypothetical protein